MNTTAEVVRVKEAYAWVDAARCVQLKAITADGAPIELTAEEATRLSERLLKLAKTLESLQSQQTED